MEYKYHYKGKVRVHVPGIKGFAEPDTDVVSTTEVRHPMFESLDKPVAKEEVKEETKKKHKK